MKLTFLYIFLFISFTMSAQSLSAPESIVFDTANNRYFISNNGSNEILARDAGGNLTVFTNAISSGPHGLEIVGNTLFACDGSSVKGFDLTTAASVMNLNLGATFMNGICSDGSNYLYATDFSAKKVFKINIAAQTFTTFVTGLAKSPNGIIYDGANQRVVWVTWGTNAPIMQATLADSAVTQVVATTLGNCDGIVRDNDGNYFVSAWGGQSVYEFDSSFTAAPVAVITGLNNPADIYYNLANDSLVSPNAGNNTVTFHFLGSNTTDLTEAAIPTLKVYPNPASDLLHIDNSAMNITSLEIWDLSGKAVYRQTSINTAVLSVDVSKFSAGVYTIKVTADGREIVEKLIVR